MEDTLEAVVVSYVAELTDRKMVHGLPREEARRQVLVEAGSLSHLKEQVRNAWLGHGIESTLQDIPYAFRSLRRAPGFTVVVVATLRSALAPISRYSE